MDLGNLFLTPPDCYWNLAILLFLVGLLVASIRRLRKELSDK